MRAQGQPTGSPSGIKIEPRAERFQKNTMKMTRSKGSKMTTAVVSDSIQKRGYGIDK
jgi:hypothetical protein